MIDLKIGDQIYVKDVTETKAIIRDFRRDPKNPSTRIDVQWVDRDGAAMGRSSFFEDQEGTEWWRTPQN
jgi:hypothetical protein